ncbi:MAG: cell filamentation protein Fic [Candidatus Cloacimonadota bacterium]|nr:MAG: cell filamentation protein Fic [Candidatus Cloacimonadota bacterium]
MCTKQWIWTGRNYPYFTYNQKYLDKIILEVKYNQGILNGIYTGINSKNIQQASLNLLTLEALDTSAIEGNILNRDSVRSSIAKKLGIDSLNKDVSTIHTDGLIDILLDASNNYNKEFTLQRLFGWHNALFPTGYSSHTKINVAQFRGEEEMQVVSGLHGQENVHYIAPPRKQLDTEMAIYLEWLNDNTDLSIIKAGIAHLWFVIIHPLDDGNGRVARAISDMLLARELNQTTKLFSISSAIKDDKINYYKILESSTNQNSLDITLWLEWLLNTLLQALKNSRKSIQYILDKTSFWDFHKDTILNERQLKLLNKLLDMGIDNFKGNINTRKYASITKTSKTTASRELKDLLNKNCIIQCEGTSGRNISYEVLLIKK